MTQANGALPLSRFRVLDLTRVRAGPTCVRQLADWGADVIKIEMPEALDAEGSLGGPRHGPDFQNLHRNKRAITLNLKDPEGLALFKRLVERADVVVENYRPDVKYRLGVDYEALRAVNPRIVYGSISGFGEDGPYQDRPGFDQIAQGMGGLMSITALLEREVSGEGQWVRTSLLQAQIFMLDFQAARWLVGHEVPPQAGNNHPTSIPTGVFKTRDGHINIAVAGNVIWARFCKALKTDELPADPRYKDGASRSKNRDALNAAIEAITVRYGSAELIALLNEAGVPCGPIYAIDQVFADPQVQHLGIAQPVHSAKLGELQLVGQPFTLSRTGTQLRTATPERGQDTEAVLGELGLNAEEIRGLRERTIV
jgi:crotonobetainyl-CoA:carnitine CoA-transferase CaiB-like acyl-CoA transferase